MSKPLLDTIPMLSQIRRNHGLEHATMHILSERFQGLIMAGISGFRGFTLMADLPTESVTDAALEALKRLQSGEMELAIHEHCGTNLAASITLAGLAAWLILAGLQKEDKLRLSRLPLALLVAIPVFVLSKPAGPWLQRNLTTSGNPGNLTLAQVTSQQMLGHYFHLVTTRTE